MFTNLLLKLFIRRSSQTNDPQVRLSYGLLAGATGVAVNLLLFAAKIVISVLAGSVAVAADAVNNLSDAGSSVVTLIGFKMSSKPADNEHPFGHGRIEYVAGLITAVIIIAVGLNFLKESLMRIFRPEVVTVNVFIVVILLLTVGMKVWLFFFYRQIARKIDSAVISGAAFDSLSDIMTTSLVIVSMLFANCTTFPVDGCAGVVVAAIVIVGGLGILRQTVSPLLGEKPDQKMVEELKKNLLACENIVGVHDVVIHNYGPGRYFATAHAEVSDRFDMIRIHDILERAEIDIAREMPIHLLLHCDPFANQDNSTKLWRVHLEELLSEFDPNFKVYDFRVEHPNAQAPELLFHLLIPRNYIIPEHKITAELQQRMRARTSSGVKLRILYTVSYV